MRERFRCHRPVCEPFLETFEVRLCREARGMDVVSILRFNVPIKDVQSAATMEIGSPCASYTASICIFVSRCTFVVFHTVSRRPSSLLCIKTKAWVNVKSFLARAYRKILPLIDRRREESTGMDFLKTDHHDLVFTYLCLT